MELERVARFRLGNSPRLNQDLVSAEITNIRNYGISQAEFQAFDEHPQLYKFTNFQPAVQVKRGSSQLDHKIRKCQQFVKTQLSAKSERIQNALSQKSGKAELAVQSMLQKREQFYREKEQKYKEVKAIFQAENESKRVRKLVGMKQHALKVNMHLSLARSVSPSKFVKTGLISQIQ